ncbi:2-iminoacetate synthase ThiH [Shewanella sp. 202IG2-18]|uniref:2-iminoacetate synthase ThiH n=1 Tax=Parashewanella hymeniacidonis TaxID=2807618 RepID=UPI00195F29C9|nr:2-iminoacetate synthase ThiH [Parashewanella hymeniacidonis]MBM7072719.1 2-iminoacetate synthase ThiH [Parashewanella hymeniacidonis]
MNTFTDVFKNIPRDELALKIYSTTDKDVERALNQPERNLDSLLALLSPAAEPYIEQMAQASVSNTRKRFGSNIGMYLPMYVSNLCANECDYCGFTMSNKIKRKILSHDEIRQECEIIKAQGYDSILIVSGEHETKVGIKYFSEIMPIIKQYFSYIAFEVQPLKENEYKSLAEKGMDAVMVYQETYHPETYRQHHTRGHKSDFQYRLETPDRLGRAQVDKIGLGVLLGLDDWRLDALLMGHHLYYLEHKYWRSRYSVSLPRLRPCVGGVNPKVELTDIGLVQLISAFRLFNPQLDISLSTRESADFRDNIISLGITQTSAGSSTEPGGYLHPNEELNQFEIGDERSVYEVVAAIKSKGLTPVFKDWESEWIN